MKINSSTHEKNVSHNILLEKKEGFLPFCSYLSSFLISIYTTRIMPLLRAYLRLKRDI